MHFFIFLSMDIGLIPIFAITNTVVKDCEHTYIYMYIYLVHLCKSFSGTVVLKFYFYTFSSVAHLFLTLRDPMDHSTSGIPVHHQLPEFTQTHVH